MRPLSARSCTSDTDRQSHAKGVSRLSVSRVQDLTEKAKFDQVRAAVLTNLFHFHTFSRYFFLTLSIPVTSKPVKLSSSVRRR